MNEVTIAFLSGALTFAFVVAGLFFLRFWKKTKDPLFLQFAIAFWLFALNQFLTLASPAGDERTKLSYLLRIAGNILILIAIFRKNSGIRKKP